ncbi:hypothetical protein M427DRAFT_490015 [Gonapodya prolifera JEL478]|uniref:Uncharacterized protein n=1 Tax=Gonapodya prolifera (strain JEL478) TaxID=1344416 RepID=A0A138ZYE9_GONPJ|nr:hypothetical protein M427DRAFT_490015 [Gonapodya prolifera JEL478]|eukprot:KXS09526.1 hypothetical protein M427DRAFT_490015 [Gonapodya prolifera JEL478]
MKTELVTQLLALKILLDRLAIPLLGSPEVLLRFLSGSTSVDETIALFRHNEQGRIEHALKELGSASTMNDFAVAFIKYGWEENLVCSQELNSLAIEANTISSNAPEYETTATNYERMVGLNTMQARELALKTVIHLHIPRMSQDDRQNFTSNWQEITLKKAISSNFRKFNWRQFEPMTEKTLRAKLRAFEKTKKQNAVVQHESWSQSSDDGADQLSKNRSKKRRRR